MKQKVTIEELESGYIVTRREWGAGQYVSCKRHRTAETTFYGAVTLAARSLGYRGLIRFEPETAGAEVHTPLVRAVEVPVVSSPADYAPPGVPFDAEEPPLRAGTARPDDLL